ncbi:MAG: hypothetical protein KDA64_16675 [Rhodospirillaceae bacterium]|nr:hypothetical protein [Rhodospirillaceae bacterium]
MADTDSSSSSSSASSSASASASSDWLDDFLDDTRGGTYPSIIVPRAVAEFMVNILFTESPGKSGGVLGIGFTKTKKGYRLSTKGMLKHYLSLGVDFFYERRADVWEERTIGAEDVRDYILSLIREKPKWFDHFYFAVNRSSGKVEFIWPHNRAHLQKHGRSYWRNGRLTDNIYQFEVSRDDYVICGNVINNRHFQNVTGGSVYLTDAEEIREYIERSRGC